MTSDHKQLDEIYRDFAESDKFLLENKRKHFTPDSYAVKKIKLRGSVGLNGPEAGVEVDIGKKSDH